MPDTFHVSGEWEVYQVPGSGIKGENRASDEKETDTPLCFSSKYGEGWWGEMIRRITVLLAIILLIGALFWGTYGQLFILCSIGLLVGVIILSMAKGCRENIGDYLLGRVGEK